MVVHFKIKSEAGFSLLGVIIISAVILILLSTLMTFRSYVTGYTKQYRLRNDRFNIEQYIDTQLNCSRTWAIEKTRCLNHQFINLHNRNPEKPPFLGVASNSWKKLNLKDKIGDKNNGYVLMRARCQPCPSANGCPNNRRMVVEYSMFTSSGELIKEPFTNKPIEWRSVKDEDDTFCREDVWN